MRNNKLVFGLIIILTYSLIGCGKRIENPILGQWNFTKDSVESGITLSSQSNQQTFSSTNLFNHDYNGVWTADSENITLTYHAKVESEIDSILFNQSVDGTSNIDLYHSGERISGINQNGIQAIKTSQTFSFKVSGNTLTLSNGSIKHTLTKYTPPSNQISFLSILRGLGGMAFLIALAWGFSINRKAVNWKLVGKGLILQLVIAILVLKVPFIEQGFDFVSRGFVKVIDFTNAGVDFLFGQFGIGTVQAPLLNFAFIILPTIIFFSALVSLFYYYGVIQKIVYGFAWVMKKFMSLSGAESLAAAGNVFLGQTESPLLVKPYLGKMTKSEMMCLMTGGMATIAGGVLAAYVGFLGGDDPVQQAFFAKHLLTASIISAPAAVIAAKILVPETESFNEDLSVDKTKIGTNALEAISNGTTDGLKLAINVGAMLLVFIALMALGNYTLGFVGHHTGLNDWIAANTVYDKFSFEFILGYIGRPIVWLLGVNWADSVYVGELLGTKTVVNEFVGYMRLGEMKTAGLLSEKSTIMSTYILCGFANFASIGIQIGGIGALVPNRKGLLSKLGVRALIGGTVACLMTAAIVGMMY